MKDFEPYWFVAGGWAIDLYLGKVTRRHEDIEIAILRKDQSALQSYLKGWRWQKIINGERFVWNQDELLESPIHELYCSNESAEPHQIEVLLNESSETEWLYRRNENITRPLAKCQLISDQGIKFLCPEVVLLYKSKNPRPIDEQDFAAVVSHLDEEQGRG